MGGGELATRPGQFTPGKDPVPIVQDAGWAPGSVWTGAKKSRPHRGSIPGPSSLLRVAIPTELSRPDRLVRLVTNPAFYSKRLLLESTLWSRIFHVTFYEVLLSPSRQVPSQCLKLGITCPFPHSFPPFTSHAITVRSVRRPDILTENFHLFPYSLQGNSDTVLTIMLPHLPYTFLPRLSYWQIQWVTLKLINTSHVLKSAFIPVAYDISSQNVSRFLRNFKLSISKLIIVITLRWTPYIHKLIWYIKYGYNVII